MFFGQLKSLGDDIVIMHAVLWCWALSSENKPVDTAKCNQSRLGFQMDHADRKLVNDWLLH